MTRKGTIYLFYKTGELVIGRPYTGLKERDRIISYWEMIYAAAYENCFLQIAPEANEESVNEDGTNKRNSPSINGAQPYF